MTIGRAMRHLCAGLCFGLLAGCGVTYTSPTVSSQAAGAEVRILALTAQSVAVANNDSYRPRTLPAVFAQLSGGGSGLRGAGALPTAPSIPDRAPEKLELRLPPQIEPTPYRIGVGDVVLLATRTTSTTVEQLSGLLAAQNRRQGYTVRDDGTIAIPEIGTVRLAGLTIEAAEAELFELLLENQIDPAFSLEVAEYNSKRVSVGGGVGGAKLVPITLQPLTLGEALTSAGGITVRDEEFASIRLYRDGTLYQIPMTEWSRRPELRNLLLADGDAVFVDTSYDLDRALQFYRAEIEVNSIRRGARSEALAELNAEIGLRRQALEEQRSNFRTRLELDGIERDYVYLTGEVNSQGRYTLPFDRHATLADVLFDNGGFETATGDPAEIYVLRASDSGGGIGEVTAWHLDASNAANLTLATRMQMRPNDIVFIEEQPITKWGRALQQTFPLFLAPVRNAVNG